MRTLYITEEQERSLKNRVILAEADDRIKKVNKIIDAEFSNLLNLDEPVSGVEYYVNNSPETTWRAYLLFSLRHKFGLMTNADMKYLPVVAKLAFSNEVGFDKRNDNGNEIGILLKIVGLFKKDDSLFQKVKANINNITFNQLYEQLKPQLEQSSMIDTHNANHVKTRDDYDVVEVPDFQTANFYGDKSCSVSKLCYTQNEHTWNEYTKNRINKVYVCLKHGWENIPEEVGEGNPYDEYGTSMIFVFIDPEGNITTSNCRWNHRTEGEYNGSVDHAFTKATLCETVGKRFDETFKPHSTEYLMKKGYMPFDTVQELLDNGEKPEEIFNYCGDFYNGIACVKLNGKYNYINTNNQLISKTWFDYGGYFRKGFACVELYGKYNFINANGQIISDTWFDDCYAFYNGFAVVRLNGKWNFINTDGQIISNTWFDGCGIFKNGFARVELNNKYNFINTNGKLLSDTWFDDCGGFDNGFAIVKLNGKINYINTDGQIVESKGRKTIYITEAQRKNLTDLLLENEGTNMKRARKYLESKGYSPEKRQQILDSIRTDIPNSRLQQCKFLLGVTRLYMEGQLNNGNAIANLNKTLKYIASDAHVNEYDFNLNGENLDTLVDRFKSVAKDDLQASMNASNARQLTVNNKYTVVPINDFKQSSEYGEYTSWCVTHYKKMYNSYTNNGSGRFYFCLHKGFENEPMVEGDGCPLDNYGLSMIAVSVTMEGEVNTITCRWNHDNGGNDSIMTIEQLEDVIGRNFYQTFKPYTREELHAKGFILFDEVQELLDDGKKPEEIFDKVGNFRNGFTWVQLNGKCNFINGNNQLISNTWFDGCCDFRGGFARVELNDKWNYINTNGQIIYDTWFDYCENFYDGFAIIVLNNKYNFINTNGQLLSKTWFDNCWSFINGFARVELNRKKNYINTNNQLISDIWFDGCGNFINGFARVKLNDKYNFINTNGQLISNTWFDDCDDFYDGFAVVRLNGKSNLINTNGQLISKTWFDYCVNFYDGFARVQLNNKHNYINTNGQIISNTWFDGCNNFNNGFAIVRLNGQEHYINTNGQIVESKGRKNKHIIITEEQEKSLKESILLNSFPEDIADVVYKNKTSIGNNPALPNIFEKGYVEKLVEKRFKGCVDELKKIGEIDDVPDTDMQTVLGKLVLKCQKLEEPHRPELEKIVANYLIDLFGIPDDSIQMELSLVDDVDLSSSSIKLDPADGDEFIEYEDVLDAESIKDEVYKRRLIDAISMGAGMKISSNIKDYMKEIYEINPALINLYRKILALNDYLLFTKEDIGMTEEDKHQFGTVEVVLGQVEESPKILAQGVIFPILLSESVRGLMELFASHGLPQEFEKAQSVLSKSDYLKAEPWDMRIGPALWEIISDSFGNNVKTDLIPYLYKRISQLPVKKFNFFMREVLAKTRKGKRMMAKIAEKSQYEKEYSGFEDKMSKFNANKNVITDEYIHPDEL